MHNPPALVGRRQVYDTYEDAYCTILFWVVKFSGFHKAKTSVNKRLFLCPYCFTSVSDAPV